jgi:very-short-patch-repair endonuclease
VTGGAATRKRLTRTEAANDHFQMHSGRDHTPRLKGFARVMRHESTDAERKLWSIVRNGRLGGFKFRRQVPVGGYILDFYCVEGRLAVELDGGQHYEPGQARYDQRRTARLTELRIQVTRFSDVEMLKDSDAVAGTIFNRLQELARPSPQPSPGVPGEGAKTEAS